MTYMHTLHRRPLLLALLLAAAVPAERKLAAVPAERKLAAAIADRARSGRQAAADPDEVD